MRSYHSIRTLTLSAVVLAAMATALFPAFTTAAEKKIELPGETATFKPSNHPGYAMAQQQCMICHSADYVAYQPPSTTPAQWKGIVTKMQKAMHAPLTDEQIQPIADYLTEAYSTPAKK